MAAEIRAAGGEAMTLNLDVTSPDSIKEGFAKVLAEKGRIDILVNNAGITRDGLAMRMKQDDWDLVLKINLSGRFSGHPAGAARHDAQARWGRIVNIASVVGQAGSPGQANYAASKAGLIGLTKALAQEMGSRGITVNAVAPGFIETDMTARPAGGAEAEDAGRRSRWARMGKPEDVAAAVKFLASEDAAYITGHVLAVNGGMYM